MNSEILILDDIAFEIATQFYLEFKKIISNKNDRIIINQLMNITVFPKVCRSWHRAAKRFLSGRNGYQDQDECKCELIISYCPPQELEIRDKLKKFCNLGIVNKNYNIHHFINFKYLWEIADPLRYKILTIKNDNNNDFEDDIIIRMKILPDPTLLSKKYKNIYKLDLQLFASYCENIPKYCVITLRYIKKVVINYMIIVTHYHDKNEDFLLYNSIEFDRVEAANVKKLIYNLLLKNADPDNMMIEFLRKKWPDFDSFFVDAAEVRSADDDFRETAAEVRSAADTNIDNECYKYLQSNFDFFH